MSLTKTQSCFKFKNMLHLENYAIHTSRVLDLKWIVKYF